MNCVNNYRICEFSSDLFGGFQYKLNLTNVVIDSLDDIITLAISSLRTLFETNKLYGLVERVDKLDWHIHSHTLSDIFLRENETIWICDHDHKK